MDTATDHEDHLMTRIARLLTALLVALFVLPGSPAVAAEVDGDAEAQFLELINATRAEQGLDALVVNDELTGIARAWSHQMDADDDLHHNPHYAQQYTGQWRHMGENVGYTTWPGGTVEQKVEGLHQAFLDSPGHYANIVGEYYNQAGVGVVLDGDTLWVTVNFLDGPVPESGEFSQDGDEDAPAEESEEAQEEQEEFTYYVRHSRSRR